MAAAAMRQACALAARFAPGAVATGGAAVGHAGAARAGVRSLATAALSQQRAQVSAAVWRQHCGAAAGSAGSALRWKTPRRSNRSTASPMGATDAALGGEAEERQFVPGFEEVAGNDDSDAEAVRRVFDLRNASNEQALRADIQKAIHEFAQFDGDTGSTPVQVAVLTVRIQNALRHCTEHRKDVHSKRGLVALVEKRRKLLQYLKRKDFPKYHDVLRALNLRPVAGLR